MVEENASRGKRSGSGINAERDVQGRCFLREFKEDKLLAELVPGRGSLGTTRGCRCGPGRGHRGREGQGCTWVRAWTCPAGEGASGRSHSWLWVQEDASGKRMSRRGGGCQQVKKAGRKQMRCAERRSGGARGWGSWQCHKGLRMGLVEAGGASLPVEFGLLSAESPWRGEKGSL